MAINGHKMPKDTIKASIYEMIQGPRGLEVRVERLVLLGAGQHEVAAAAVADEARPLESRTMGKSWF